MRFHYQPRYKAGDLIGNRYKVHYCFAGGMGEVYLCMDTVHKQPFALKTFQGSRATMEEKFQEEVKNWIALGSHPNIVRLYHVVTLDKIPFMLMEWVSSSESRGTDLRSWLRRGALEPALAIQFTLDIVRGLIYANSISPGIVHRDLKPDNVLVNDARQAKITDFGLAAIFEAIAEPVSTDLSTLPLGQTMRGAVVGTPLYMPPEQWLGKSKLDFRSDIYAVGCILYELLSGEVPYREKTWYDLKEKHLNGAIPQLDNSFAPMLNRIIHKCMAKSLAERYQSLQNLYDDLKQVYALYSINMLVEPDRNEFGAIDYHNRGTTYNRLDLYELAIEDFNRALDLKPNYVRAFINRGIAYEGIHDYQRALEDYYQAIALEPDSVFAYQRRGRNYLKQSQLEAALRDLNRALSIDSQNILAYLDRAQVYQQQNNFEAAMNDYEQAISLDPDFPQIYVMRVNYYVKQKQYDDAIADCDRALQLDNNYLEAYKLKIITLMKMGHLNESLEIAKKASKINSEQMAGLWLLIEQTQRANFLENNRGLMSKVFGAVLSAKSYQEMERVVAEYPFLTWFVPELEAAVEKRKTAHEQAKLRQQIEWLKQLREILGITKPDMIDS